jgi:two-component system, chemotaxis family, protein-glutamate methylesterase/glutaminase
VRQIVAQRRVPIIMVSALTQEGADITFRALDLGAVDFIAKPDAAYENINDVARDLVAKVRTFAGRGARPLADRAETEPARVAPATPSGITARDAFACAAIGTSTGGPVALSHIIPSLPATFPIPAIIVQHMPRGFTRPLAERLNALSKIRVSEAVDGMILRAGEALVVPSGRQITLRRNCGDVEVRLVDDDGSSLHVPSVDLMTAAVADIYGRTALGVILTGMGQDGVRGLHKLKSLGGYVVGQDEATSVVYGMPRAAAKAGLVDRVAPLDDIAGVLVELTSGSKGERPRIED